MPCFQLRLKKKIFVCDTSGDVNFSQWPWRIGMGIFGTGRFCLTKSLRNPGCQWRYCLQNVASGNSLAIQWSGPHTSTARGTGSIPGQENKIRMLCGVAKKLKSIALQKCGLQVKFISHSTEDWEIEIIEGEQKLWWASTCKWSVSLPTTFHWQNSFIWPSLTARGI